MPRAQRSKAAQPKAPRRALLYVEGAGDRAILEGWARTVSPRLERAVREAAIILGGRQPARARAHLAKLQEQQPGLRGLCVLDRDVAGSGRDEPAPGLEVYTWGRRHIESYLLAPDAIRRGLGRRDHDGRLRRFLAEHFPAPDDEAAFLRLHAKHLLGPRGPLALELGRGRGLPLGRIARRMRPEELHPDVRELLTRLCRVLDFSETAPVVAKRRASGSAFGPRAGAHE